MNNGNLATERADVAWRGSLPPNIRNRMIADLAQALKPLSPGTQEAQLFNVAKAFETSIYSRSNSTTEYYTAYTRKSAQILQMTTAQAQAQESQVSPNVVGVGGLDSGGCVFQQVQALSLPALQSSQQTQTFAKIQQTQQLVNQVRPQILVAGQQQQQRPILSQQQIATRQLINARHTQAQQRAMVAAGGQHQPPATVPQQVQQQVQTAMATHQNFKNLTPQQINLILQHRQLVQQQAVHTGSTPATASQPTPTGVLLQQPRLSTTAPQISARPKMTVANSHPSSVIIATESSVQQKLAMTTQQPQAQEPSNPAQVSTAGIGKPPQAGVSHSQHGAAVQLVQGMDKTILANRVKTSELHGLSEEEKIAIRDQVALMTPMFQRVDQLLPVFLALTSNQEATKRLMLMKYMFQDQLEALPHNKFVISLANLKKLKEQFSRYFMWVKNQIGGHNQTQTTGSSTDTNAQASSQQKMMTAQRIQELRQQQIAGPLKHAQLDLKLPPAKRQATGSQQPSPTTGTVLMQQNSQGIAASAGSTPLQVAQSTPPERPSIPGLPLQQQAIDAAIAAGLAPQVATNLSREALQAQYGLQQANAGKALLTPQQKAQLHSLYASQVALAKNLVTQQANTKAFAATLLQQNSAAAGINQKPMEIQQPAILNTTPTVDAVEYKKQQIRLVQQKQMQATIRQQQQQPQPIPTPTIKIEPMDVPTPRAAVASGTASQPDIRIKEEPEVVALSVTVKTEPVEAPKAFISPEIKTCEKSITDPRLHSEDVIRKFVEMHVDESRQNDNFNTLPVFPATHVLAPVVEVRSGAGYFGDEDCMQEDGGAVKRPVTVRMKDILKGFSLPEDDNEENTDRENRMIDSSEVETGEEKAFRGKCNLGEDVEAVRREISKLGHDWVLSPS